MSKLRYLSISSALNLLSTIAYVVILIFLIYDANALFLLWLDTIVVLVVGAVVSGLALRRS